MKATAVNHGYGLSLFFLFLLYLLLFTVYRSCSRAGAADTAPGRVTNISPETPEPGGGAGVGIATLALKKAPEHVRKLIKYLKSSKYLHPPKGYRGGRVFRNREGILPKGKTYYEFDVHPVRPGVSRGAERLVVDQQKSVFYYTKDHYGTFTKIK
ncbi:MAG: hypothetical protein H6559_05415 [Lewinellaceae bacterium]|nr:hypothetical protein [Sinomicrobium sp.]MCB9292553.1 hypothetical protein [Lewinellaceae bacterium]